MHLLLSSLLLGLSTLSLTQASSLIPKNLIPRSLTSRGFTPPHKPCNGGISCSGRNPIHYCTFAAQIAPKQTVGTNWHGELQVYVWDEEHQLIGNTVYEDNAVPGPVFTPFSVDDANDPSKKMQAGGLYLSVNSWTSPDASTGKWSGDLTFNFGKNEFKQKNKNLQCMEGSNGQTGTFRQCFAWFNCGAGA